MQKRAIVVGSGAGGAMAAKELQGEFDVTLLEAGKPFRPFDWPVPRVEKLKKTGLLWDEREIQWFYPAFRIRKTIQGMVLVSGRGLGGTTTLCAGNALRMDADLKTLGIDLNAEFEEVFREIPVTTAHQKRWRSNTRRMFKVCQAMGLEPVPIPKMGDYERCTNGYIISPYFDYVSYLFNRAWGFPARDIYGLMVKLADENQGSIARGRLDKSLTPLDRQRLDGAVELCSEILCQFGAAPESIFLGTLKAGHSGGMLPPTARDAATLHPQRLPWNLYVADATLFPRSMGNPPILTIVALAKQVSKRIIETIPG